LKFVEGIYDDELLLKAVNILLLNFEIYVNAEYDPDLALVVEKICNLLFSNKTLLNIFKDSYCYSYLLYSVYVYEKGISFGEILLPKKKMIKQVCYVESKFYNNKINLIRKLFLEEDKPSKDQNNLSSIRRLEEYLKWLFFHTLDSENITIINNYLKIIFEIYEKCKIIL